MKPASTTYSLSPHCATADAITTSAFLCIWFISPFAALPRRMSADRSFITCCSLSSSDGTSLQSTDAMGTDAMGKIKFPYSIYSVAEHHIIPHLRLEPFVTLFTSTYFSVLACPSVRHLAASFCSSPGRETSSRVTCFQGTFPASPSFLFARASSRWSACTFKHMHLKLKLLSLLSSEFRVAVISFFLSFLKNEEGKKKSRRSRHLVFGRVR